MSKHVLVTGFEPFGGDQDNPSELVARAVAGRLIQRRRIATEVLAVETALLRRRLEAAVMRHQPDLIVCLGEAKNRKTLSLERVALNLLNFDQPDNAGELRRKKAISPTGPYARLCNLPLDDILDAWNRAGIIGSVSNSAGSFLCNQVFYEALGLAERLQPSGRCGVRPFAARLDAASSNAAGRGTAHRKRCAVDGASAPHASSGEVPSYGSAGRARNMNR